MSITVNKINKGHVCRKSKTHTDLQIKNIAQHIIIHIHTLSTFWGVRWCKCNQTHTHPHPLQDTSDILPSSKVAQDSEPSSVSSSTKKGVAWEPNPTKSANGPMAGMIPVFSG